MPPIVLPEVLFLVLAAVPVCLATTYVLACGRRSARLFLAVAAGTGLMLWLTGTLLELVGAMPGARLMFRQMQLWAGGLSGLAAASLCLSLPGARRRLAALPMAAAYAAVLLRLSWIPVSGYIPDMRKLPSGPEGLTITASHISPDPAAILLLTALSLGMAGLAWWRRGHLFPEVTFSLDRMVKRLPDRVVVFDTEGHLLDRNLEALPAGMVPDSIRTLDAFLSRLTSLRQADAMKTPPPTEAEASPLPSAATMLAQGGGNPYDTLLCLSWAGEDLYFRLHATGLPDRAGRLIGLVCSMQDVTETCRTARLLQHRNDELEALNRELSDYLHLAGTLEAEREHGRVSRQIHETLGQRLTGVLSVLEVVRRSQSDDDTPLKAAALDEAIAGCRAMMRDIRSIVSGLLPHPDNPTPIQAPREGKKP